MQLAAEKPPSLSSIQDQPVYRFVQDCTRPHDHNIMQPADNDTQETPTAQKAYTGAANNALFAQ